LLDIISQGCRGRTLMGLSPYFYFVTLHDFLDCFSDIAHSDI
jgi:hypothetical protein